MSRSLVRSKLKATTWVQHSVNSHPFSFMSIGLFQNLTLKLKGRGHEVTVQSHNMGLTFYRLTWHIPFVPCQSVLTFLKYSIFKIRPWKSRSSQMTMMLHNYRSRQFHRTSNGINPSSGFRDIRVRKVWPTSCLIWQVFGPWASPYGANNHDLAHNNCAIMHN